MGMLSSFLHPERAYREAADTMGQYFDESKGYLQPYTQYGQEAYGQLNPVMQQLLNPQQLQSDWINSYETSPYASMMQEEATNQGLNAASSMGLMGSTPALNAIQRGTSMITAADRDTYLNDLMNKYLSGAGIAQNIFGTGAGAGQSLAGIAQNQGQALGEMAYGENAAPGNLMGNLLGMAAGAAGTALGGPIGGALANKFVGAWGPGGA